MPEALAALGIEAVVEPLEAGDYDLGSRVLVERKTVVDLHLSLRRGRFWRQLDELRRAARLPHLRLGPVVVPSRGANKRSPPAPRPSDLCAEAQGCSGRGSRSHARRRT